MKFDATELQSIAAATGTGRADIYTAIHKALRAWLTDTLDRVGQLDAGDNQDCQQTMASLDELLDALQAHLETENAFVHPAIEARRPGSTGELAADHVSHEASIAQLRRHAQAVLATPSADRGAAALFLYRELALFVAENFEHMQVEETQNHQLLWSAYTDDELHALHDAILASVPPQKMAAILRWMLPALSHAERAGMLQEMQANAPAMAFQGALEIAQARLSVREWTKLTLSLGLPQVPGLVDLSSC